MLLGKASERRLGGRAVGVLARVGGADVTEEGRPVTERLPDWRAEMEDFGEEEEEEGFVVKLARCCAGSFALIASANAREA